MHSPRSILLANASRSCPKSTTDAFAALRVAAVVALRRFSVIHGQRGPCLHGLALATAMLAGCSTVAPASGAGSTDAAWQSVAADAVGSMGWQVGGVPIGSGGHGATAKLASERSKWAVDVSRPSGYPVSIQPGDVELQRHCALAAMGFGKLQVEVHAGTVEVSQDRSDLDNPSSVPAGADGQQGVCGGARLAAAVATFDRFELALSAGLSGSDTEADSSIGTTSISWLQFDAGAAMAYRPSSDALFAIAPFGGLGWRKLDGIQKQVGANQPIEAEFDAEHTYGFAGISFTWRPQEQSQVAFDLQQMFGQIEGTVLGLSVGF